EVYEEDGGFDERYLRSQDIEFTAKKLHRYRSVWVDSFEIVKYYNRTDNFPDYKKSLDTYALLREDMRERGIIDIETRERLYRRQLHGLFNDLLVKRAPKKDIAVIYGLLKKEGILSFTDKATYLVYGMSPGLFRIIFDTYMSLRNRNDESEATELLEYRKSLEEEVR
ncbi:MAG: hypothetical protein IIY23_02350, partial [Erysipelotrichaceae bacterium]|nr:hypothetical protein [Erysipelotrichaceae bacterium]